VKTRSVLDKELNQLRESLLTMAEMVTQALDGSIEALKAQDVDAAQAIIERDEALNKLRYKTEKLCVTMIATQQPMASDLRTIIAGMHIAVEIERMGDHAAGIAKLVTEMASEPLLKPLIDIPRMAAIASSMLVDGIHAFMDGDIETAKAIVARDDEIDQLHDQIFRELLTYMLEDPRNIRRATYLLWVSHNLERIGDRATNISERTVFAETGKLKELA